MSWGTNDKQITEIRTGKAQCNLHVVMPELRLLGARDAANLRPAQAGETEILTDLAANTQTAMFPCLFAWDVLQRGAGGGDRLSLGVTTCWERPGSLELDHGHLELQQPRCLGPFDRSPWQETPGTKRRRRQIGQGG